MERAEAVLAVWTETRSISTVARELGIQWQVLQTWQERALAGMLEALEPRVPADVVRPPALNRRLRKLLDKQARQAREAKEARAAEALPGAMSPRPERGSQSQEEATTKH
jgi:transposase-like protein